MYLCSRSNRVASANEHAVQYRSYRVLRIRATFGGLSVADRNQLWLSQCAGNQLLRNRLVQVHNWTCECMTRNN